jgi:hypothetical protein
MVDYRAEAGVQFGSKPVVPTLAALTPDSRSKLGYQLDAEVGVSPIKPLRIGVEGAFASGDDLGTGDKDEGYNELFPTAHKVLGLMDVIGPRTNILTAVLHLKYAIVEPLTLSVDGHFFSRPEAGADDKDGTVGEEVDVNLAYAIGKGFSVRGLYGIFLPSEDFWETKVTEAGAEGDALHYFELQLGYDFK